MQGQIERPCDLAPRTGYLNAGNASDVDIGLTFPCMRDVTNPALVKRLCSVALPIELGIIMTGGSDAFAV